MQMEIGSRLRYEPGEVIARLRAPALEIKESVEDFGADIVERFDFGHRLQGEGELVRLKLPANLTVEEAIRKLGERSDIAYAEPNYRYYLDEPIVDHSPTLVQCLESSSANKPNDLHYRLWGLHNTGRDRGKREADISALEAWNETVGDRKNGPIVAIIDSGVDISHPDLVDNLWVNPGEIPGDGIDNDGNGVVDDIHGYNAFHDNNDLSDGKVHGTHVAGTVGATGNNGQGITGVAQEASLMTIKIFGDVGHTNGATVLRGLAYADRMGARITANSWGGIHSKAMEEAYAASPALHIASAGNSGRNTDFEPHYPGSYLIDNMIAVAATDNRDEIGSFSNYGIERVHIAAPGVKTYSTLPGNRYKEFSGTSMACPHVAGAASLVLTKFPDASNLEVKNRLLYSSDPIAELEEVVGSGGRLNAGAALQDDTTPPDAPQEFRAQRIVEGVDLSWSEPGDDGMLGKARNVILARVEQDSKTTLLKPKQGQTSFQDVLPLSRQDRSLCYNLTAIDDVGNRSSISETSVLVPAARVEFEDTAETKWAVEGPWTSFVDPQGQRIWTESLGGDYENRTAANLTSPFFELPEGGGQVLRFGAEWALERGDFLTVQARTEDGGWRTLDKLEGFGENSALDLSLERYAGKKTQVRFSFQSDFSKTADGVSLSGIEVLSPIQTLR